MPAQRPVLLNHIKGEAVPQLNTLISQLTLEEKAALCTGASPWTTVPVERLGVPGLTMTDGPHGVRRAADLGALVTPSLPATCFPTASCLAATWNVDLIHEMGQALAEECRALKVDVLLGPGVNMKRTPLGGRNFEYFSEDPYLAGQMAADAEGASKIAHVRVTGAETDGQAHQAARKVAESMLVKCSLNGADPYWGRIASELGSAGVAFDIDKLAIAYGGGVVCRGGLTVDHDRAAVTAHLEGSMVDIHCELNLADGNGMAMTVDLGYGYIDENRTTS